MVMLLRICHVHQQSDRDPELERPKHCGGRVLSSSDGVSRCLFPICQKIPKFGDVSRAKADETK
jgi:hypothetical protein